MKYSGEATVRLHYTHVCSRPDSPYSIVSHPRGISRAAHLEILRHAPRHMSRVPISAFTVITIIPRPRLRSIFNHLRITVTIASHLRIPPSFAQPHLTMSSTTELATIHARATKFTQASRTFHTDDRARIAKFTDWTADVLVVQLARTKW